MVHEGRVFFCQDDDLSPFVVAVDAKTGKELWKTPRPDMLAGYALPVMCEANGRTDLVIAGSGKLKGYDPATGKELWTCNTLLRTIMTSPVVHDGIIYIAVQSYGDATRTLKHALLEWLDTNQDGILARVEMPKEFYRAFRRLGQEQGRQDRPGGDRYRLPVAGQHGGGRQHHPGRQWWRQRRRDQDACALERGPEDAIEPFLALSSTTEGCTS